MGKLRKIRRAIIRDPCQFVYCNHYTREKMCWGARRDWKDTRWRPFVNFHGYPPANNAPYRNYVKKTLADLGIVVK